MEEIEHEIRQFVVNNFLFGEDNGSLKAEDSFLDNGIIDSTGVLELVGHIEGAYKIEVQDSDLVPDNLDSIRKVARFVQRKLSTTSSSSC